MAAVDCINAAMGEMRLSAEAGEAVQQKLKAYADDYERYTRKGRKQAEAAAAQRLEKELQRKRDRNNRMRIKQTLKHTEIKGNIAKVDDKHKAKFVRSLLDYDFSGRFSNMSSVSSRFDEVMGIATSRMNDLIFKYRSKFAGVYRDISDFGDVVKALHGEHVDNPSAKAMADAYTGTKEYLIKRFNTAGGDVRLRQDWHLPQVHNPDKMKAGDPKAAFSPKDQWIILTSGLVDRSRMYDAAGEPMTHFQLMQTLESVWDELTLGKPTVYAGDEYGSPINSRVHHRELVFRDAESWMTYQKQYGEPNVLHLMMEDVRKLSHDIAMIEILGPNPKATVDMLKGQIPEGNWKKWQQMVIDRLYNGVTGAAYAPVNNGLRKWASWYRSSKVGSLLGSALFSSFSDFNQQRMVAKLNGLPHTRWMKGYFQQLNPMNEAHRKAAGSVGFAIDTMINDLQSAVRWTGEEVGMGKVAKMTDVVMRASGLPAFTNAGTNANKLGMLQTLTDLALKETTWDKLPANLRAQAQRYGIDAVKWELFRSTPWRDLMSQGGNKMSVIPPEDIALAFQDVPLSGEERSLRQAAAHNFIDWINTEARMAVIQPTASSKAMGRLGMQPGTVEGELFASVLLFKNFVIAQMYQHASRMSGIKGGYGFNKVQYFTSAALPLLIFGALSVQLSNMFRGKDPEDMTQPSFWAHAAVRGGAFGPLGDLVSDGISSYGHTDPVGAAIGVLSSDAGAVTDIFAEIFRGALSEEEDIEIGADVVRLIKSFTPGASLWYLRNSADRMLWDQVEALSDSKAQKRWNNTEKRLMKQKKQSFFWPRGQVLPNRAPNFGAALGGSQSAEVSGNQY